MKRRNFLGAIFGVALLSQLIGCSTMMNLGGGGFMPLFNGKDLTGWTPINGKPNTWTAKDGVLTIDGGSGWLSTDREYRNFILKLDFRLTPAANSGVFLRAPLEGDGAYAGLEIQVLDHFHKQYKDIKPTQFTGSVYDLVAAKQEGLKPTGEWNSYVITHDNDHIVVVLNGVTIVDTDLSQQRSHIDKHPGLGRKEGHIGLQAHGGRIDYRNLSIKELP